MTGNEAAVLKCPFLGEFPDDLVGLLRRDTFRVRIVMLHVRVLFHRFRMLQIFRGRSQNEFMVELAVVADDEFDLLAGADFDPLGHEHHLTVTFAHRDLHDARGLFGIARFACRERLVVAVSGWARTGEGCGGKPERKRSRNNR